MQCNLCVCEWFHNRFRRVPQLIVRRHNTLCCTLEVILLHNCCVIYLTDYVNELEVTETFIQQMVDLSNVAVTQIVVEKSAASTPLPSFKDAVIPIECCMSFSLFIYDNE